MNTIGILCNFIMKRSARYPQLLSGTRKNSYLKTQFPFLDVPLSRRFSGVRKMAADDVYAVSDIAESEFEDLDTENIKKVANKKPAAKRAAVKKTVNQKAPSEDRPVEEIYQKKTQLEHILLRPDTYIGSVERQESIQWVFDRVAGRMIQRNVSFVPGLFKIFDEILVNAADNKIRDPSMDTLKVDIDRETGKISIYNNGKGIPIEMHSKEKMYVPELIFGQLLTSSNYDDAQKKVTGGRNGYGAKLCNIFSKEFIVETADSRKQKKYKQIFNNNMSKRNDPVITDFSKEDFTKITFTPDLEKFGMERLDDDIYMLLERRVYDMAGCTRNVKVLLNGERIHLKSFKDYVELFMPKNNASELGATLPPVIVHEKFDDRWEICVSSSEGSFQHMSFVNSICTYKGGMHVNYITDQITTALHEVIKKKNKDMGNLKAAQIKNHLSIFINCLIENPTFDSQTKEYMTLRASAFGSKCTLGEDFIKKVLKCGVVESVMSWAKFKQTQQLKKTDGAKRTRLSGIAKLDDANNAGTRNASKCTLIVTEGDSAKALAVSGLSVVGRDNFGVFPLRGKLLNVREATHKQIMENAEINSLKQILGLQHGHVYHSIDSLRYGSLMIMTDQDHDGSHIKGLIINFLDHFFPSLLKIPGFLVEFITPIVKVTKGREEISFYTIPEYETWKSNNNNGRGWTIKYYKGLGTSTAQDAKKYFAAMDKHRKMFAPVNDQDRQLVDMAFSKKRADERKEWLKTCTEETFMDHSAPVINVSDFINKELILFSMADNTRSIPSAVDGLKPGHRKILFSCFKRKLKGEIKVAQLAGYVSEHAAYHHGEQSLCSTIIGMAQNFVGSNNLNLLEPIGQFGTRLQGGKDAASPRYVFTSLSPLARLVFRPEDDALLKYLSDDGQSIEPQWYIPTLPVVLLNGCEGIGTGWMTAIPNYNPREIVQNLFRMMDGEAPVKMHPWYHGFRGNIEELENGRYKITGIWRKIDESSIEISELPVGTWTQTFKEMLEGMISASGTVAAIKDYKEYHTDTTVRFIINLTEEGLQAAEHEGIEKKFKLSTTINLNNIVCFDQMGRIRKYSSPLNILEDFYHLRLEYYGKRKEWLADQLTQEWTKLDNRVRFVQEIIDGKLIVQNRKKTDIIFDLKKKGYVTFGKDSKNQENVAEETSDAESDALDNSVGYDYLLSMPIYSLTKEKLDKLIRERFEKESELNKLLAQTPKDLWKNDLNQFLEAWDQHESEQQEVIETELAKSMGKTIPKTKKATTKAVDSKKTGALSSATKPKAVASEIKKSIKDNNPPSPTINPEPIVVEENVDLNSMPLAERINYMLQSKAKKPTSSTPTPTSTTSIQSKPAIVNVSEDDTPREKKSVGRKRIISSDDEDDIYKE